ncbi:hypothetical protein DL767_010220 [Monosporascus sp. MG133]|nr:hypothetical protein DL767_010220 [Monosporascus sp. MG133]
MLEAWRALGVRTLLDYDVDAGEDVGLGEFSEDRHKGTRQIASLAYPLDGIQVMGNTLVESVILDNSSLTATGVKLADDLTYRMSYHFNYHVMLSINWELQGPSKGCAWGSDEALFRQPEFPMRIPADFVVSTVAVRPRQPTAPTSAPPVRKAFVSPTPLPTKKIYAIFSIMGMKPTSRRTVSIFSRDPADHPVTEPNYLDTEVDRHVWRQGPRTIARGMTGPTPALGRGVISREAPAGGGLKPLSANAPDELPDSRYTHLISILSSPGRCSTAPDLCASWRAVLDRELWVKGVQNLRIVDASVFPISIGAHIQAVVIVSQSKQD